MKISRNFTKAPIRPTRPATRPGQPGTLKHSKLAEGIRELFRDAQLLGRPADSLHNRVYGPKIGGYQ